MANPLVPLNSSEIQIVAKLIKQQCGLHVPLHFKAITLEEPHKEHVVAFFEAQKQGRALPELERKAFVSYYITDSVSISCNNGLISSRMLWMARSSTETGVQ